MKGFFVVLVVLLIGTIGLGFYRGWFRLSSDNVDHKANVTLSVDQDKIREDEKTVKEKVQDLGPKGKQATGGQTDKANERERQP
jgi:hypothetical protein